MSISVLLKEIYTYSYKMSWSGYFLWHVKAKKNERMGKQISDAKMWKKKYKSHNSRSKCWNAPNMKAIGYLGIFSMASVFHFMLKSSNKALLSIKH